MHESNFQRKDDRLRTGQLGEEAACRFLLETNYTLLERNWRCRSGEIDIIAKFGGRIVFVEVRTRKEGRSFGTAAESVNQRKQQQVRATAQVYLRSIGSLDTLVRFDVIAITMDRMNDAITEIKHYPGAF